MAKKCGGGPLNCVGFPGGAVCFECGERILMVFVCSACSEPVCVACINRHSAAGPSRKETEYVAKNDHCERSHP